MSTNSPLSAPSPMAGKNQPVDWMFAFKFNAAAFPGCTDDGVPPVAGTAAIFGGQFQDYEKTEKDPKTTKHSQQYVYATNKTPTLVKGEGCLGATLDDPLGATFAQIYNNPGYNYVLWNDQFYGEPIPNQESPWGHSKGMVAWNDAGEGLVLQVSTPSWPGSGSTDDPRNTGNTLGAIGDDDDIEVSQHFFALKLNKDDLIAALKALINASVATDTTRPSIVHNGGPQDVKALVKQLPASESGGKAPKKPVSASPTTCTVTTLSGGVQLISKPSSLHLPPWQLVSAKLGGLSLRVASWWAAPEIYSTEKGANIEGWPSSIQKPGAVAIATTGNWKGTSLGLKGEPEPSGNHAKIGISTDPAKPICIFGDMNQQGALRSNYAHPGQKMDSSQNGRGGTFYVLQNQGLFDSLTQLLKGDTAGTTVPPAKASTKAAKPGSGAAEKAKPTKSAVKKAKPKRRAVSKAKPKTSAVKKAKPTKSAANKTKSKRRSATKRATVKRANTSPTKAATKKKTSSTRSRASRATKTKPKATLKSKAAATSKRKR